MSERTYNILLASVLIFLIALFLFILFTPKKPVTYNLPTQVL